MIKSFLNICLVIVSLTLPYSSFAQKTELTLDEAVSEQYRKFYPKSLTVFSWVPDTDCYTYLQNYQKLMKASLGETDAKEIISIQQLNEKLDSELNWFSGFEWKNENEFWVNDGQKFYSYNIVDEKGKLIHGLDEAENTTFHNETENIAYTKQNNIYIHTGDGLKIIVTDNTDKNIVSGQAIARSEFGITNGLFWSPNGGAIAYYQKDESKVADYPLLDNSATPGKLTSIKYPMTGQDSEKATVGIYNITNRSTVFISTREGKENYLTNLSWTPDNKYVVIAEVNRDQDHYWLNVFDATTGAFVRTLLEEEINTVLLFVIL